MSVSLNTIKVGDVISYKIYKHKNYPLESGKFLGKVSALLLPSMGFMASELHRENYRYIPPAEQALVRDDAEGYEYILLETLQGDRKCIGVPWLVPNTLTLQSKTNTYVFEAVLDSTQLTVAKQALAEVGVEITNIIIK